MTESGSGSDGVMSWPHLIQRWSTWGLGGNLFPAVGFTSPLLDDLCFNRKSGDAPPDFSDKITNIFKHNFRGIFGILVPFCGLIWQGEKLNHAKTVKCAWLFMTWCALLQPVDLPVVGLIPIFILPMTGVLKTPVTVSKYMNESIVVFLLGSMINMLLNNSGFDRRLELSFLRSGDNSSYNPRKLVFKAATAAFVTSIFSSRQIVANDVIAFLAPTLLELKGSPDTDFDTVRAIVCTAAHVGAAIGSFVFPHGSMTVLAMRAQFYSAPKTGYDYPDVFNYMQYIIFCFPLALVMFVLSTAYFMVLIGGKTISPAALAQIGGALNKHKDALPKNLSLHEKETIFFLFIFLVLCIFRWCKFLDMGWTNFALDPKFPTIPQIRDATCCSILVILLFSLPKGFGWIKYFTAKTYKDLPPKKTESGILFWRYIDKQILYGYLFLFGAGMAISDACLIEGPGFPNLASKITLDVGKIVTDHPWNLSIFIVCFVSVFLGNIMPGLGAAMVWFPFVVNMARAGAPRDWELKLYLGLLGSGIGTGLGFMCPFLHTPAYFTHYVGKTPKVKMAKTAVGAVVICFIILWLAMCFVAPFLWDPNNDGGFVAIIGPDYVTPKPGAGGADAPTTAAPETTTETSRRK